ncbi:MAG TPA: creatininase family protein [Bacillota bacterium]|nr:creatininase family protein [Bacillota bacterium]
MDNLSEFTWADIDKIDRSRSLILFPIGAFEQHGRHLPLGTDNLILMEVLKQAQSICQRNSMHNNLLKNILCLPPLLYGNSHEHLSFPGTVSLNCRTIASIIENVIESLSIHGFKKLVVFNSHGGNTDLINACSQEWEQKYGTKVFLISLWSNTFSSSENTHIFESCSLSDIHAGERETSLMLFYRENLVKKDEISANRCNELDFQPYYSGWQTGELSPDNGTIGNPCLASVEKGQTYASLLAEQLVDILMTL